LLFFEPKFKVFDVFLLEGLELDSAMTESIHLLLATMDVGHYSFVFDVDVFRLLDEVGDSVVGWSDCPLK
jgi:hypothetical protein